VQELREVAPAFVHMAHTIVWCTAASVDAKGRPRSRILHPLWQWDGETLSGWIATSPTRTKREHISNSPFLSCTYWTDTHDTCTAECEVDWRVDNATRISVWEKFKHAPPPVGYDPAVIPQWRSPTEDGFAVLHLVPWRLRVLVGDMLSGEAPNIVSWER